MKKPKRENRFILSEVVTELVRNFGKIHSVGGANYRKIFAIPPRKNIQPALRSNVAGGDQYLLLTP